MSSRNELGRKKLPSGLWRQLAAWRSDYVGNGGAPADAPEGAVPGAAPSHHSVLVPIEPGLSGSFPICLECGEVLLPGAQCTHGPLGREAAREEDQAVAGRLLGGKWRVLEAVGGGSFGTFWKGEHHILGMKVGIKVLRRHLTATPAGLRRFHEEAMRVSLLNHPGIVKLFDYGQEEDGIPYLVMEYLRGTPLHSYIQEKALGLDDYVEIVSQVTRALIPAHRGEFTGGDPLVHLDLKPEHIFVERIEDGWHVKVIDFGLAEITGARREETGAAGGTPLYMGPERFRGIVDPRSDLYSLGVVLYECVAGRRPFESGHLSEIRAAHESQVPMAPGRRQTRLGASSSRKLDSIILSTLAKDLEGRPRNAEELLERLESWKRLRAAEREARKWSWRAKRLAAVSLGAIAAVFFFLWLAPGASLTIQGLPETVMLGKDPLWDVSVTRRGFGFSDAPVYLYLEADGENHEFQLQGTPEPGGEFHVKWPDQGVLEARRVREDRVFQGTFFSRRMGRTVWSLSACKVRLDYKEPDISEIRDASGVKLETQEGENKLLWVFIPPGRQDLVRKGIEVFCSEPLNLNACSVDGEPSGSGEALRFLLHPEPRETPIVCRLVDLAGNEVSKQLLLHEVKEVSIEGGEKPVLTKARKQLIEVTVHGDLGHIRVLLDGEPVQETPFGFVPGSGEHPIGITVPFKGILHQKESRRVTFQAWSILGDVTGKPDAQRTVILEWLDRPLEVDVSKGEGLPRVRALEASTRREAKDAEIEGTVTAGERAESIRWREGFPEIPEGMRGNLLFVFTAMDRYGNRSDSVSRPILYPDPPRIASARIGGGIGTQKLPLHSADCGCRPLAIENKPQPLVIETVVEYAHSDDLEWKLYRVQGEETSPLTFTRNRGSLELPLGQLLRALDTGENTLRLSVFDRNHSDNLIASKNLLVRVERLDPRVYPDSGVIAQLDSKGRAELQIDVGEGHVESVTVTEGITGNGVLATREESQGLQRYKHEGIVKPHGYTTFVVEVKAGGRTHRVTREYHRLPAERLDYVFPVRIGDSMPFLSLQFQRTSDEGQAFRGFWFSPPYLGASSSRGVTRSEALSILRLAEKRLGKGNEEKRSGASQRVRLATSQEFRSLLQRKLIAPADGYREWLEPGPGDPDPSPRALYGEVIDGELVLRSAKGDDPVQRAAFRAVIEYGVPGSELEPCKSRIAGHP